VSSFPRYSYVFVIQYNTKPTYITNTGLGEPSLVSLRSSRFTTIPNDTCSRAYTHAPLSGAYRCRDHKWRLLHRTNVIVWWQRRNTDRGDSTSVVNSADVSVRNPNGTLSGKRETSENCDGGFSCPDGRNGTESFRPLLFRWPIDRFYRKSRRHTAKFVFRLITWTGTTRQRPIMIFVNHSRARGYEIPVWLGAHNLNIHARLCAEKT